MAPEIERLSVSFTPEAEAALMRVVARFERRIRAGATDEAIRRRGIPAEVTGSDISKAESDLMARRIRAAEAHGHFPFQEREWEMLAREASERRPRSTAERIASWYIRVGIVVAVLGFLIPMLLSTYRRLIVNDDWRLGLTIAAAGLSSSIAGAAFKAFIAEREKSRRKEPDFYRFSDDIGKVMRVEDDNLAKLATHDRK